MPKPKFLTKTQVVLNELKSAISAGKIRPGDRIRIEDWADRLGVSATPVREALKTLEAEGYLESLAHRGARVTSFSAKEFLDYWRMRGALDALAAQLAAEQPSRTERERACSLLSQHNDQFRIAVEGKALSQALRSMREFHRGIYKASQSSVLINMMEPYWDIFPVALDVSLEQVAKSSTALREIVAGHNAIIKAILKGDAASAKSATTKDIEGGIERLRSNGILGPVPAKDVGK